MTLGPDPRRRPAQAETSDTGGSAQSPAHLTPCAVASPATLTPSSGGGSGPEHVQAALWVDRDEPGYPPDGLPGVFNSFPKGY